MSEPLTEDKLREYRSLAKSLSAVQRSSLPADQADAWVLQIVQDAEVPEMIAGLVDEVDRLKVREAALVADFDMIRVGLVKRISDMEIRS